jgi:hypothetical protein
MSFEDVGYRVERSVGSVGVGIGAGDLGRVLLVY